MYFYSVLKHRKVIAISILLLNSILHSIFIKISQLTCWPWT